MRLTEEERSKVERLAAALVEPSRTSGVAAYGSKVAGYARPDSDYDLIIVSKRFREGVRYRYVDDPVAASALIVDEDMLVQDARSSYLGEFVVGRLLNIYEPLSNPELFRAVEHEYKKRVIVEALLDLSSDYGEFGSRLVVPYDYFLFEKLHRRAAIYPPALYSYVHTYTSRLGDQNRAASVDGFRSAAESLQPRGFLVAERDGVRLVPERLKGDAFTRVQSLFSVTARGVAQYAVHGYAGRVGPSVFSREALSKLRRMREAPPKFAPLDVPRSLLKLDEGAVIPDASFLVKELARLLGFDTYSTTEKDIGEPYSTTRVLTFRSGHAERSVVVKNYTDVRSLKWALLGIWASTANKFSAGPLIRMDREYGATLALRAKGVLVPRILAVAPAERVLVKDFVPGPTLASEINTFLKGDDVPLSAVGSYGSLMARVHGWGMALGDAKPSNVIVSREGLYLTDLEQAYKGGDQAWDVAEFLYYTAKLSNKEGAMKKVAVSFLDSYVGEGDRSCVAKAKGSKYFGPFRPFLTPGMAKMLRELMSVYA
ncbi:MAG: nucleotidyltransferase domain-containing protein [Nitrososphaerota archaeon]|nr:nucleotidyltransferase domain-containing protein [Nitrososphaerota archaeon]MDG6942109.1 nucleotidyltransferase domain-containing protein [Nitrososphaerota archaeon]MDG6942574.1 nucleotidyltransferase domain-containing protein [Nitrososphaerota archaeon]MDG6948361.1 nucleotidyltransferase domain-containing protein [Nitrososphaerota archaeon]MDG6950287.1 nucleotidyltransferase domain-containing protein [Nitrososphaerota archaeon]